MTSAEGAVRPRGGLAQGQGAEAEQPEQPGEAGVEDEASGAEPEQEREGPRAGALPHKERFGDGRALRDDGGHRRRRHQRQADPAHEIGGGPPQAVAPERRRQEQRLRPERAGGGARRADGRRHGRGGQGSSRRGARHRAGQRQADRHGDQQRGRPAGERGQRALPREVDLRQHLGGHRRRQPRREGLQRGGGLDPVDGVEAAALEQDRDDRRRQHPERGGGRQRQQQAERQRPVHRAAAALRVAGSLAGRDLGQEHHAHRDRDEAQRHLEDAVGVIQPAHRAGLHGCDLRRHEQHELRGRAGEQGRRAEDQQPPHRLRQPEAQPGQAGRPPAQRPEHDEEMQRARDADGRRERLGQAERRLVDRRPVQQHGDHHDVERDRREGRHKEALLGVEDRRDQRGEHGEGDEGQREARVGLRQMIGDRRPAEAPGERQHQPGRDDLGERDQDEQRAREVRHGLPCEAARRPLALLGLRLEIDRHEGRVQPALAEHAAEHVGQAEGDEEGVRHRPRAQRARDQDVAHEAEEARQHGRQADDQRVLREPGRFAPRGGVRLIGDGVAHGRQTSALCGGSGMRPGARPPDDRQSAAHRMKRDRSAFLESSPTRSAT